MDQEKLIGEIAALDIDRNAIAEIAKSAKLSDEATACLEIAAKAITAHADTISPEVIGELAKSLGYVAPIQKAAPPAPKAPAISPEMRAEIEKRDAELAELRKSLAAETEARVQREYVEKATKYQVPGFTAATLGPVLKSIETMLPADQAKAMSQHFASVTAMVAKSDLFKSLGATGTDGEETREERIEKCARELSAKNGKTIEQNYAQAMRTVKE